MSNVVRDTGLWTDQIASDKHRVSEFQSLGSEVIKGALAVEQRNVPRWNA